MKEAEPDNKEDDNILKHGYGYDFGDWKSYPTPELAEASDDHKEIAELFNSGKKQIIVSRTCSDMNYTPNLSKQIKLLILTTDDSPALNHWQHKAGQAKICVCDATRGSFLFISNLQINIFPIFTSDFFKDNFSCIAGMRYGRVCNETVDVGCCF
jgi:hypothetical protein